MIYIFYTCIIIGILLLVRMYFIAHENHVHYLSLTYNTFPSSVEKLTIFFISDIHKRIVDETIINEIKEQTDIVVIGGDLTEKNVPLEKTEENLARLSKVAPVYFIWGNNDFEVDKEKLLLLFEKYNVTVLENKRIILKESVENRAINLIGVGEISFERDNLSKALQDVADTDFNIIVCHNPEIINNITTKDNISLILSGHTHGGQIRIFGMGPGKKGDLYRYPNMDHLISNGYGTTMLPLRLGAHPETHLITIKHK